MSDPNTHSRSVSTLSTRMSHQVRLNDDLYDTDPIWTDMRDDLADLEPDLPLGASAPDLVEFELAAYTLMVGLTWELEGPPEIGRASCRERVSSPV